MAADKVIREIMAMGTSKVSGPGPNNFFALKISVATAVMYKVAARALIKGFFVISSLL